MKLTIIGTGYIGLVTGTCFSEMGNMVYCVDIDEEKIESLKKGVVPIYEPGLEDLLIKNYHDKNLIFTKNLEEALDTSDICFIAVGTPMDNDGSADLKYVLDAAKEIGEKLSHNLMVVNKSTVPVGTAKKVKEVINKEMVKRGVSFEVHVASNPEFLREGTAVKDFMNSERLIIGSDNEEVFKTMKELYGPVIKNNAQIITMDIPSAEMTKYAANTMLATRISFINEIANICERVGADINRVREGIGSDTRIGYNYLYPGCGYGGSCLPKDVQALIKTAEEHGYDPQILKEVEAVNCKQKLVLVNKITNRFGRDLEGYSFALWGLSFKPETDDMRESPSITIINELTKLGAKIKAYDPKAIKIAKKNYFNNNPNIKFSDNKYAVLNSTDALIIVTEWKEFRSPDFEEIIKRIKNKIIFDGRNQYNPKILNEMGFEYYQMGNGCR